MINDEINDMISRLPAVAATAGEWRRCIAVTSIKGDSTNYVA